jgi:hypothetical protein
MTAFWDAIAVATCRHEHFLDGPDAFGARLCAQCGQRVTVCLTPALFKTQANLMASRDGFRAPFPEID